MWQPIETAPKIGPDILVYCPHGQYVVCWGGGEYLDWWYVDDNKFGPYPLRGAAPTHWQPLPPPPEATATPTDASAPTPASPA